MTSTRTEVEALLGRLNELCADELASQQLDFKKWDPRSTNQSVRTAVWAAVCMANGGGGTLVFGVADNPVGRECAIVGVPPTVSVNRLKLAVYDGTDPKLTPGFEEIRAPEGMDRLILMHVHRHFSAELHEKCGPSHLFAPLRAEMQRKCDPALFGEHFPAKMRTVCDNARSSTHFRPATSGEGELCSEMT